MQKETIGFIGTGVMGKSMSQHLLRAGYPVHIYTRTKEKALALLEEGAVWQESIQDIAQIADVVITMIGTPKDVEEVYLGENGLLTHGKRGTFMIDMTTSKPKLAMEIFYQAKDKGIHTLDAPVSGGDVGAKNATLTIMVGGEESTFRKMLPILNVMGNNIILQGGAGAGQHTKMVNQISIAPAMIGLAEALLYVEKANLSPMSVLQSISTGAAGSWSLDNYAPRMLEGDFSPGFAIKHYIKDLNIALEAAEEMKLDTPGLRLALDMYEQLAKRGESENGIHAIINYYT